MEKMLLRGPLTDIALLYKQHIDSFWTEDIFHFDEDLQDWHTLLPEEQHFIKYILAFFARADLIVADNLVKRFLDEVQEREAQDFYAIQNLIERIHNKTYENMLKCFVSNHDERELLNNAHLNIKSIREKAEWAAKWMNPARPFGERLIAFICIEGIHFSSSFAGLYWIKDRGIMKQLTKSNEYIARDEGLHVKNGMALFGHLIEKPDISVVHSIFREAVELEMKFCEEAIPCNFKGLNTMLMKEYVRFIANQYLDTMGLDLLYPRMENPLIFVTKITAKMQVNFFETENPDYRLATGGQDDGNYDF